MPIRKKPKGDAPEPPDSPFDPGGGFGAAGGFDPGSAGSVFDPGNDNLNNVEHLDPPPTVGGEPKRQEIFGNEAAPVLGRASSPRLFAQAAQFPTCAQLRVFKLDNGVPVGLGVIAPDATEEDLVSTFFDACSTSGRTQFRLRPIDINNEELGQEFPIHISEHHTALKMIRDARAGAPNGHAVATQVSGMLNTEALKLLERMALQAEDRAKAVERTLEADRLRVREAEQQMAQERVDLATNAAQGVRSITERMMQDESERAKRAMEQQALQGNTLMTTLTAIFAQQSQAQSTFAAQQAAAQQAAAQQQQAFAQQQLEAERQRAEREYRESETRRLREAEELRARLTHELAAAEQKIQRERAELDAKLARENAEREARDRREQAEAERRATALEAERTRQHNLRMEEMKIAAERDREHAARMASLKQAEVATSSGSLETLIPKAIGIAKMFGIEPSDIFGKKEDEEDASAAGAKIIEALAPVGVAFAEILREHMKGKREQSLIAAANLPISTAMVPAGPHAQPSLVGAALASDAGGPGVSTATEEPESADPVKALPLAVQRNARTALRALVAKLRVSPEAEWVSIAAQAYAAEGALHHFFKAAGLERALKEAGASDELAARVRELAKESGLLPAEITAVQ